MTGALRRRQQGLSTSGSSTDEDMKDFLKDTDGLDVVLNSLSNMAFEKPCFVGGEGNMNRSLKKTVV